MKKDRPTTRTEAVTPSSEDELIRERIRFLRDNTDFISTVFDSLVGYAIVAADFDGNVIAYNEGARQIYGYAPEEIIGRKNFEIFFPKEFIEEGKLNNLKSELIGTGRFSYEGEKVKKDGSRFPAQILFTRTRDKNNQIVGFVEIVEDLTERKRGEKERLEMEQQMLQQRAVALSTQIETARQLGDRNPDALLIIEPATDMIRYINSAAVELFGRESQDLLGQTFGFPIQQETASEIQIIRPGGEVRDAEMRAAPITWEGTPAYLVAIRDMTERKRRENERLEMEHRMLQLQKQKYESLGVMAGGIAHDFNNLLTTLLGNLEMVLMELPPESPARPLVEKAALSGTHAAELSGMMQDYSGKGPLSVRKMNLSEWVQRSLPSIKAAIPGNVKFDLRLNSQIPPIMVDETLMLQVVTSLITNASEAIGEQTGTITLATGTQECSQDFLDRSPIDEKPALGLYVFLEVSDTGCGMDEETKRKIFEPFFTTKFPGRGLGLSAAHGSIRSHRGVILIDSEPRKGTVVRVLLPVEEEQGFSDG